MRIPISKKPYGFYTVGPIFGLQSKDVSNHQFFQNLSRTEPADLNIYMNDQQQQGGGAP